MKFTARLFGADGLEPMDFDFESGANTNQGLMADLVREFQEERGETASRVQSAHGPGGMAGCIFHTQKSMYVGIIVPGGINHTTRSAAQAFAETGDDKPGTAKERERDRAGERARS